MENGVLLISFVVLLISVFVFKKLWLGVLLAILIVLISKLVTPLGSADIFYTAVNGFIISGELSLLLFGAYLFYNVLNSQNHFLGFTQLVNRFSSKLSVVIILCWFMGSFMEGIAGFGIPAMLVAPLMMAVGFKPSTSIVLPLAANTTAVTFGALGTPLKIGLAIHTTEPTVLFTLLLNILPAIALPFILAFLYSKTEQIKVNWGEEWKMILGAGVCFLIPYSLTGLLSIEYPSVVAGILGLITFVFFFIPKKENQSFAFWWATFYPYFLFVLLLVIAKHYLSGYYWAINETLKPISLYQPGVVFIISSILYLFLTRKKQFLSPLFNQSQETFIKISKPILTIVLLVCFAQLIQKDVSLIAHAYYSDLPQSIQLIATPIMGIAGSFITGSATMSNLLLSGGIRASIISESYLPLLLALLHTGSALGNAISFQNIVMVKSVINKPISEIEVLRYNLFVVGFYWALVICTSFVVLNFMK